MNISHFKNTTYQWIGIINQGQRMSGEILAQSLNLAKSALAKKDIQIISIRKKRRLSFKHHTQITSIDIILFLRQLSTLIIANIPVTQAIYILSQNLDQTKLLPIISIIKDDIAAGKGLAHSLQKFPRHFDEITQHLINAGEKTGTLNIMLDRVATYKENSSALKNKIKQAMLYPAIIFIVAMSVTAIMLTFVVPRFADLFHSMHSQLPLFTTGVITIANYFHRYCLLTILSVLGFSGLIYYTRHLPRIRTTLDLLVLRLPGLGIPLQKFILARFARSLAIIFAAGIPITEALKILTHTTGNTVYTNAIQALCLDISIGKQLHFAMQTCKLFPPMMLQMIQIGEESGTLEKMLAKIADFYESDLDHLIGNLSRLLEPLIMIILGVVIGGLVIAMYLPIFKLGAVI